MWHMRIWGGSGAGAMKMLICTPPKGGLGLGMGPLWDPSIGTPARRAPARRRPAPPWPPTEPQIKKTRQSSAAALTTRALAEVALGGSGTPSGCFRRPEYPPGPPCETPTWAPGQVPAHWPGAVRPYMWCAVGLVQDTHSAAGMQHSGGRHGNGTGRYCAEGGMKK